MVSVSVTGPYHGRESDQTAGSATTSPAASVLLRAQDLVKSFGGVRALQGVTFELAPKEIHALVGENGAGKSTLVKILAGFVVPDFGKITMKNEDLPPLTQSVALKYGITIVPQEIAFAPRMSVAEMMALTTHKFFAPHGLINWRALYSWAQLLLDEWELSINARSPMAELRPAQHVTVSIVSALNLDVPISVLILDEPTASFSPPEVEHLFGLARRLRDEGRSIIFVTHRLNEVAELSDRVTVLRDGELVGTYKTEACSREELISHIVGHQVVTGFANHVLSDNLDPRANVLDVDNIGRGHIGPVSFSVRRGEIVGFAGLVGAGRTELFRLLYGLDKPEVGTVRLEGREVRISSPVEAVRNGMALAPEERRAAGLVMSMSVRENVTLMTFARYARRFSRLISKRLQREAVTQLTKDVQLRAASIEMPVRDLSGGNQQKVVIGRCLSANSKLLIFDEPTRGVDIGAKEEIFQLIRRSARDGAAVLVASSETDELVGLCHRVLIMHEGLVVSELSGSEIDAETIARLCFRPASVSVGSA